MVWAQRLWLRLQSLLRRNRSTQQLDDEIQFHLEQQIAENVAAGMSREEARYAAMRAFGNPTFLKEETRDTWGWIWLEQIGQDLRRGARMLRKNPGFTAVGALTLALGIGANAFAFSIVNAWLLQPLHLKHPDRLVIVLKSTVERPTEPSVFVGCRDYVVWKRENRSFESMAGAFWRNYILTGVSEAQELRGMIVTDGFFETLGVPAQIGRTFTEEDLQGPPVVVLSHDVWQNRFGGSPDIVGRSLNLNGKTYRIVGIMPRDFYFRILDQPNSSEIWALLQPGEPGYDINSAGPIAVIGRLKVGVSPETAQSDLFSIQRTVDEQYADNPKGYMVLVAGLQADNTRTVRASLFTLSGAVVLVLLIACTNLSNLLLSRSMGRQKEMAIRTALGSGRCQLIRQLLTENAVLALFGGGLGILCAYAALHMFVASNPLGALPPNPIILDSRALAFTAILTLGTTALFGLAPALQSSHINLNYFLKETGNASSLGVRSRWLRSALVVGEVALSLVLLTGASLMVQTLVRLRSQPLGFQTRSVSVLTITLPESVYSQDSHFHGFTERLLDTFTTVPGVSAVGATTTPLLSFGFSTGLRIDCEVPSDNSAGHILDMQIITPNYFSALGITILRGRSFSGSDERGAESVVIVNEVAGRLFGKVDPIGKHVRLSENDVEMAVVGIVADTSSVFYNKVAWETRPRVFIPLKQAVATHSFGPVGHELYVYLQEKHRLSLADLRHVVRSADPDVPLSKLEPLAQEVSSQFNDTKLRSSVLGGFALLALLLSAVGIYGAVSQSVLQRTREIGIRVALGARTRDIVGMVVRQGMLLVLFGTGVGTVGAFMLAHVMKALLYGVTPGDPVLISEVAVLSLTVAFFACYIPARRAMRVDPIVAVRYE
jgi:predicted permease